MIQGEPEDEMALSTRTRACTRAQIMVRAELSSGKTRVITGSTSNVSLKGVYFLPDKWVPVGTECQVTIRFAGPTSSLKIEGSGRIVRSAVDPEARRQLLHRLRLLRRRRDEIAVGVERLDVALNAKRHVLPP
mgnify:CR=1 FL=1